MFLVIGSHNRVGSSNSAALPAHGGSKRKDIEGLRAIAVLLVLLWHAGITQIPGGFVGVDCQRRLKSHPFSTVES
jgi:hypothetical protein